MTPDSLTSAWFGGRVRQSGELLSRGLHLSLLLPQPRGLSWKGALGHEDCLKKLV